MNTDVMKMSSLVKKYVDGQDRGIIPLKLNIAAFVRVYYVTVLSVVTKRVAKTSQVPFEQM